MPTGNSLKWHLPAYKNKLAEFQNKKMLKGIPDPFLPVKYNIHNFAHRVSFDPSKANASRTVKVWMKYFQKLN